MRILISLATAITILAVALVPLLTPLWTHPALGVVGVGWWFGGDQAALDISDRTISDLITFGRFDFLSLAGPVYNAAERAHMRDVQLVLYGFLLLALVSMAFLAISLFRGRRDAARWTAVARGGIWLIVGVVVLGVFAFVAFDTVFTLFHEIFFPGGNWSFPADSNLIRLYPELFWELSSLALGTISIVGAVVVWFLARRRAAALTAA